MTKEQKEQFERIAKKFVDIPDDGEKKFVLGIMQGVLLMNDKESKKAG